MADEMRVYDDVKDMVEQEIEKIVKKDELDPQCLEYLYKLIDIAKDVDTIYAMSEYGDYQMGEDGYSTRMYPHYSGNSYQRRDSMGRYSRNGNGMSYRGSMNSYRGGGYSREGDTMSRLQTMMDEAQTEREREAIRRAMESM